MINFSQEWTIIWKLIALFLMLIFFASLQISSLLFTSQKKKITYILIFLINLTQCKNSAYHYIFLQQKNEHFNNFSPPREFERMRVIHSWRHGAGNKERENFQSKFIAEFELKQLWRLNKRMQSLPARISSSYQFYINLQCFLVDLFNVNVFSLWFLGKMSRNLWVKEKFILSAASLWMLSNASKKRQKCCK